MNVHVVPSRRKQLKLQDQLYLGQIQPRLTSLSRKGGSGLGLLKIGITIGNKKQGKAKDICIFYGHLIN